MKILIVTGIFPPEIGGPATYAVELGKKMVALGHMVRVVTYSNPDADTAHLDEALPFPVDRIVRQESKLSNYWHCFTYLLKNIRGYDVVYGLDWFSAGFSLYVASRLTFKPYVIRVGGGYMWEKYLAEGNPPVTLKEFYEKGLYAKYRFMYEIIGRVLRGARFVIFNSEEQAHLYNTYYDIPAEKIRVVFNPTELVGTKPVRAAGTPPTKEIVFAGRLIVMKNVDSLLAAFAKLKDPAYTLRIIGSGPEEGKLRALAAELGIADRITWNPSMSRTELYSTIINCAYVVIPSWTDISPNQAYECLILGIPFLLTYENYLAINKQLFVKIDPKRVDDIADKMNRLLDPTEYQEFVMEQKVIEFSYTWDEAVKDHLDIFKQISDPEEPKPRYSM